MATRPKGKTLTDLLRQHFGNTDPDKLEVHSREFPHRVSVDAYRALADWIGRSCQTPAVVGVPITDCFMTSIGMANLLAPAEKSMRSTTLKYDAFEIGEHEPANCIQHGLWLLGGPAGHVAVLWTSATVQSGC